MPAIRSHVPTSSRSYVHMWCGVLLVVAGCDLFAPRTPEPPSAEAGTFVQPAEPDLVAENIQNAIRELSPPNYRRSLVLEDFVFEPTAAALARDQNLWAGWGVEDEVSYFSALVAAAQPGGEHELRLSDPVPEITVDRYVLDAAYVLTVVHGRVGAPTTVQGRLRWEIVLGDDNLWRLKRWTDRAIGDAPSWSDLKTAFIE